MPEISRAQIATYAVLALVVVVLGVRFMQRQQPSSAVPGGAGAAASSASSGASGSTATAVRVSRAPAQASVVHVAGAVRRPGVYRLPAGARVQEAVRRAGGARRGANVNGINLAAKVVDGQRVYVAKVGQSDPGAAGDGTGATGVGDPATSTAGGKVNLNTASQAQLEELPGIGPTYAEAIVAERQRRGGFTSVNDLRSVRGIGDKRFAELAPLVTV